MMRISVAFAVIASIYLIASSGSTPATTSPVRASITAERPIILAQESPQVAACQAEGARLTEALRACGDNQQCRAQVQTEIETSNKRCRNVR